LRPLLTIPLRTVQLRYRRCPSLEGRRSRSRQEGRPQQRPLLGLGLASNPRGLLPFVPHFFLPLPRLLFRSRPDYDRVGRLSVGYQGGTQCAINRAVAFAPYADLLFVPILQLVSFLAS
jgi:hypothetical protein